MKKVNPESGTINYELRQELEKIKTKMTTLQARGKKPTELALKNILAGDDDTGDFLQFYNTTIEYLAKTKTDGYIRHLRSEYESFKKFAGDNISFADITTEKLQAYEVSLKVKSTTLNTKMKRINDIIKKAVKRKLIHPDQVEGYQLPTYVAPEREYLTLKETEKIATEIYAGKLDDDPTLKKIACYFLIECYSGIRFSDWHRFQIETLITDRNFKVRAKKNGQPIYLPLNVFTRLGAIVDYVIAKGIKFDLAEQTTNRLLKVLASRLQITKNMTTHLGRHTCATLLAEMGYTTANVSEVLGISENTAKTYIKHTRQGLTNVFEKLGGL